MFSKAPIRLTTYLALSEGAISSSSWRVEGGAGWTDMKGQTAVQVFKSGVKLSHIERSELAEVGKTDDSGYRPEFGERRDEAENTNSDSAFPAIPS